MKKRVLCYGDSNTWGYTPGTCQRYPEEVRWTGICQQLLGEDYIILEDGMNGRTTVLEDPFEPDYLNGMKGLSLALMAQKPLDLVVIMLGSNDLKFTGAVMAAKGAAELVRRTMNANAFFAASSPVLRNGPRVLLVSPIEVGEAVKNNPLSAVPAQAIEESRKFPELYRKVAELRGCHYLNAADYADPSPIDGMHISPAGHARLGAAIADKIREILSDL